MRFLTSTRFIFAASLVLMNTGVLAEENSESTAESPQKELQDMSDPLAVYTRQVTTHRPQDRGPFVIGHPTVLVLCR